MTADLAIDLRRVVKTYPGQVMALRDVAMQVRRGEIFGLLGPNGAGKSTLVKIIMTVVRPTQADGVILGKPLGHKPTLARVGYLPESHRFPRYLTGRQTLEFFAALSGVDRKTREARSMQLLESVGMAPWANERIGKYSKGMLQRMGLASAMMARPDLLVLDEPTDGVDPLGRRDIRDILLRLRQQGVTIFINSHLLSELEMICDRVAILVKGQVTRQGTIDELTRASQRYEIELALPDMNAARSRLAGLFEQLGAKLEARPTPTPMLTPMLAPPPPGAAPAPVRAPVDAGTLPSGAWVEVEAGFIRIGVVEPTEIQPIVDALRAGAFVIRRVMPVRLTLEQLFMQTLYEAHAAAAPNGGVRP